ncbi:hypothetical protein D515_04043 [Grimontia indica]|uniref:Uncharacterized protein n=1 Tax=Grimontia indica TaxID=1056512 RepID=R1IUH2_9GAMM|nr:hypothetical protein D515_04043 [Grimontia indica]
MTWLRQWIAFIIQNSVTNWNTWNYILFLFGMAHCFGAKFAPNAIIFAIVNN